MFAGFELAKHLQLTEVDVILDCVGTVRAVCNSLSSALQAGGQSEADLVEFQNKPDWALWHIVRDLNMSATRSLSLQGGVAGCGGASMRSRSWWQGSGSKPCG